MGSAFTITSDAPWGVETPLDDEFGNLFFPPDMEWQERGACRNIEDRNIFFSNKQNEIAEAKHLCSICPVTVECRAWCEKGSELGYDTGVWAGTTHKERKRERKANGVHLHS